MVARRRCRESAAFFAEFEHIAHAIGDQSWKRCAAHSHAVLVNTHLQAVDHDGLQVRL
jgi:hypothetical protein